MRSTFNHLLSRIPPARILGVLLLSCACLGVVYAQAITGRISGTVTDPAGAVLPNISVVVTNEATSLARTITTDADGFYTVTNLPAGAYSVTVEQSGFKKLLKTENILTADGRLTVDLALETGEVTESVEITSSVGETVNTTSGEVARVIDGEQVQNLALNGRNFIQLATLIPGSALLDDNQLALTTSLNVNGAQSVNGNRTNTTSITIDGSNNLDSGSNNSIVNNVGIDFIQEVKIQTSNFSAEYGRNSGAAINLVTRSGGNDFHGSLFEFVRNDRLDARNFFSPRRGKLRFNDFGFAAGGPVIVPKVFSGKDKFFFFFGMEWKKIRQDSSPSLTTIPTVAERNGNFSQRLRGFDNIVGTADDGVLRNPANATTTCVGPTVSASGVVTRAAVRTGCFPGNIIPANLITADGRALANVYTVAAAQAALYLDTPTGNNTTFQQPNPFDFRQEILRLDYRFNDNHTIYGRYLHDMYDLIDPFGTFIGGALPTIPSNRLRPGTGLQLSYTWLISPSLVNEASANVSYNRQRIPPANDLYQRDTYGFTYPQLFSGGQYDESIPDATISGFGNFNGAARSLLSPTTDIVFRDNVSITRGSHSIKTGVLLNRNRKDQNGRPTYAGNLVYDAAGNPNTTGNAFADGLLGNFRRYSEAADDPIGFFRYNQYEGFLSDNWKVNRKLSLELGVRYQYGTPIYTQANNMSNFVPALYDPARAVVVRLNNGTIDPASIAAGANRYNGLIRAGDGIPADELGRVTGGDSALVQSIPTGAPRGLYEAKHRFGPRVSFAYSPFEDNKTSLRGGFGMFYDRPEGNITFDQIRNPPFLEDVQFENGNISNPSGGTPSALAPFSTIFAIDPELDVPYTMNFSVSVQRELPRGLFAEVAYVGNLGRHLIRQPDINRVPFEIISANNRLPAAQRANENALRPYKGYSAIRQRVSDSNSNYHGLQVYVTKRKGDLLLTSSYTWSKVLTDASGNGDDSLDLSLGRQYNYGPASFDRRHISVTTYTYSLPFFRTASGLVRTLLAGYELSGITRFQTGQYLTPSGGTSTGGRRADYIGGDVNLPNGERSVSQWFNTAAFRQAPDGRPGSAGVGIIQGPGRQSWDISLRKRIIITETTGLEFRAELFNAFNRANFTNLNSTSTRRLSAGTFIEDVNPDLGDAGLFTDGNYGRLTGVGVPRNVQLAVKFTF
ncbi:MAG TPA: carboxypeptidase-like regulatory domain-containing protein [Pyrinomonadaceae bacterium]|nr:carboxypeptidase-like regulatory domain-containing protein [Pyrinomonadaceae bacterium]